MSHPDEPMNHDTKLLLGKILGEVFRIQRRMDPAMPGVNPSTIYGLLHGFEHVIDRELELIGSVSHEHVEAVSKVLNEHWSDPVKLAAFKGFYDIERQLRDVGVDRGTAMRVLTFFAAEHMFTELIEKMNSSYSPIECKTFEMDDHDS